MLIIEAGKFAGRNYRIVLNRRNHKISCIVECPKCGREGRLVAYFKFLGRKYCVVHEKGYCNISFTDDSYEVLDELYKKTTRVRRLWRLGVIAVKE